jgi:ankyrin repeat protein
MRITSALILLSAILAGCGGSSPPQPEPEKLHTVAALGSPDDMAAALDAGADVNMPSDFDGASPLISASTAGSLATVELLVQRGADLNIQTNDGTTALHIAALMGHDQVVATLQLAGADSSIKNSYGSTAYDNATVEANLVRPVVEGLSKVVELDFDEAKWAEGRAKAAALLKP